MLNKNSVNSDNYVKTILKIRKNKTYKFKILCNLFLFFNKTLTVSVKLVYMSELKKAKFNYSSILVYFRYIIVIVENECELLQNK